jgi:hypothetical protein
MMSAANLRLGGPEIICIGSATLQADGPTSNWFAIEDRTPRDPCTAASTSVTQKI